MTIPLGKAKGIVNLSFRSRESRGGFLEEPSVTALAGACRRIHDELGVSRERNAAVAGQVVMVFTVLRIASLSVFQTDAFGVPRTSVSTRRMAWRM
jgi:hypothetical protein